MLNQTSIILHNSNTTKTLVISNHTHSSNSTNKAVVILNKLTEAALTKGFNNPITANHINKECIPTKVDHSILKVVSSNNSDSICQHKI